MPSSKLQHLERSSGMAYTKKGICFHVLPTKQRGVPTCRGEEFRSQEHHTCVEPLLGKAGKLPRIGQCMVEQFPWVMVGWR